MSSVGFIDEDKNFLQNFTEDSTNIFSQFNNIPNVDVNFSIPFDKAKDRIDNRGNDKLGGFAKIYYYMFPYIWQESFFKNLIINQSSRSPPIADWKASNQPSPPSLTGI